MSACTACMEIFGPNDKNIVNCSLCSKPFHLLCADIKLRSEKKELWKCKACLPIQSNVDNVTLQHLLLQNNELLKKMDKRMESLEDKVSNFLDSFETVKSQVDENTQGISLLKEENTNLKGLVKDLATRVANLEQRSRMNNIEITGVPFTKNEDVFFILNTIADKLGINIRDGDILVAHRVRAFKENVHPSIIANLKNRVIRSNWIKIFKAYNKDKNHNRLSAHDLHPTMPPSAVFINEHLTGANKKLLRDVKLFATTHDYDYVWVADGKILLRKSNSKKNKTYWIRSLSDLPRSLDQTLPYPGTSEIELQGSLVNLHGNSNPTPQTISTQSTSS